MTSQASNQAAKSPTQSPTQVAPAATPQPLAKFVIAKCSKNRTDIVKVLRTTGTYYAYEYSQHQNHLIPHVCTCQPKVTEASLLPLYSMNSVLFVFNTVTQHVEQYRYSFGTDTFEQMENTGLIYNPSRVNQSPLITTLVGIRDEQVLIERDQKGSLRKQILRDGGYKVMTPSTVLTLMQKSIEMGEHSGSMTEQSSATDSENEEHAKYTKSLKKLVWISCQHHPNEVIIAFNYTTEQYDSFVYCDVNGKFIRTECACDFKTRENHLIPKYWELGSNQQYVIHVYNEFTCLMEQYVYCLTGFKQVNYPELVYNPAKDTNTTVVLCLGGGAVPLIVLLRDSTGRLKKEQFSFEQGAHVPLSPLPVQTFLEQRKEALKKRNEEEKRAQRPQEKVDTAPRATAEVIVGGSVVIAPNAAPVTRANIVQRAPEHPDDLAEKPSPVMKPVDGSRAQKKVTEKSIPVVVSEVTVKPPVTAPKLAPKKPIIRTDIASDDDEESWFPYTGKDEDAQRYPEIDSVDLFDDSNNDGDWDIEYQLTPDYNDFESPTFNQTPKVSNKPTPSDLRRQLVDESIANLRSLIHGTKQN